MTQRRTKIAEGIWRDRYGLAGVVKVDSTRRKNDNAVGEKLKPKLCPGLHLD